MSDDGLPPAIVEVLACLEKLSHRLRSRASGYSEEGRSYSLRLAPAWPAAYPAGPPPEPVPTRTVVWRDLHPVPAHGRSLFYAPAVPFLGQEQYQTPGVPGQGPDLYTPVPPVQGPDQCPGPTTSLPGPATSLQDPDRYQYPPTDNGAAALEEQGVLEDGEVRGEAVEAGEVSGQTVADGETLAYDPVYGDPSAMLWRCCGCGWACCTTYKGLRIHQDQGRCGWDSDLTLHRAVHPAKTKTVRPKKRAS